MLACCKHHKNTWRMISRIPRGGGNTAVLVYNEIHWMILDDPNKQLMHHAVVL